MPTVLVTGASRGLGPRGAHREQLHKQFFGSIDYDARRRVIEINALAPLRIAEGQYPIFGYCSSKAALNKAVTMVAMAVRERGIVAAALCPGHAKTELGGSGATVEVRDSIAALRKLIARLGPAESGTFTRYTGERVAP